MTVSGDPVYPRVLFAEHANAAERDTMSPYDIWFSEGYSWFGDGQIANMSNDSCVMRCWVRFPLRFSRLFRNPIDVGRNIANQFLSHAHTAYLHVDIDLCSASYANMFGIPVKELVSMSGLRIDWMHERIQPVLRGEPSDVLYATVRIEREHPMLRVRASNIGLSSIDCGDAHVSLPWFRFGEADMFPLQAKDIEKHLQNVVWQQTVHIRAPLEQAVDERSLPVALTRITERADRSAFRSGLRRSFYSTQWRLYNSASYGRWIEITFDLQYIRFVARELATSGILKPGAIVTKSAYECWADRPIPLAINCLEPYWREMRRVLSDATLCFSKLLTPFALLYVLDLLPLMWVYPRQSKMAHLERCFKFIRQTKNHLARLANKKR